MFYQEGVKFACFQLGLTKEALTPTGLSSLLSGIGGAGRGAIRGGLVGGATGAVLGEEGDRWNSAMRGLGYGALLGGAVGGVGSAARGSRMLKGRPGASEQFGRIGPEANKELGTVIGENLGAVTRPGIGATGAGVLGGLRGTTRPEER